MEQTVQTPEQNPMDSFVGLTLEQLAQEQTVERESVTTAVTEPVQNEIVELVEFEPGVIFERELESVEIETEIETPEQVEPVQTETETPEQVAAEYMAHVKQARVAAAAKPKRERKPKPEPVVVDLNDPNVYQNAEIETKSGFAKRRHPIFGCYLDGWYKQTCLTYPAETIDLAVRVYELGTPTKTSAGTCLDKLVQAALREYIAARPKLAEAHARFAKRYGR
jgi:hypothetical protein